MQRLRNAVITGGSTGIGLAVAKEFLTRGHNVYICSRASDIASVVTELALKYGAEKVGGNQCDVRQLESVEEIVAAAAEKFGEIDTLINNAGIAFVKNFEDISSDQWRSIIDTNLTGVFNCCKSALPWLKKAKGSDIVNLGSRSGRYSFSGGTGYNTTKFGLQGFSEALFLDLQEYGVRVSLVAPGTVATGLGGTAPENWHLLPEDIARVIADLIQTDPRAAINWVEIRPARPH